MPKRVVQHFAAAVWELAGTQHGVVARWQLLDLGMSAEAIKRRVSSGRLHRVDQGVYAVGRPNLDRFGRMMAAVLGCGRGPAAIGHRTAAMLFGIVAWRDEAIHVVVAAPQVRRRRAVIAHQRDALGTDLLTELNGIPVTIPAEVILDIACSLSFGQLERAIGDADKLDRIRADELRAYIDSQRGRRGVARVRAVLDLHSYRLTHSVLEQKFLAVVRRTPLPLPDTQKRIGRHRVDFIWTGLGLVVETDGFTYHRTAAQQSKDQERDHAHLIAGRTSVRFTHRQIAFEADYVERTLTAIAHRLGDARGLVVA